MEQSSTGRILGAPSARIPCSTLKRGTSTAPAVSIRVRSTGSAILPDSAPAQVASRRTSARGSGRSRFFRTDEFCRVAASRRASTGTHDALSIASPRPERGRCPTSGAPERKNSTASRSQWPARAASSASKGPLTPRETALVAGSAAPSHAR
eukprot:9317268-Pyramimonas_sp.AAC.1